MIFARMLQYEVVQQNEIKLVVVMLSQCTLIVESKQLFEQM